jgi:N-acetyltransferase
MARMEFRPPLTLDGSHLRLLPLSLEHLEGLVKAGESAEIWEHLRSGDARGPTRMRSFIEELLERQEEGTDLPFTVVAKPSLRPIGMTRFLNIHRGDEWVEVGGTWFDRTLWRTPVNTESKFLLFQHAFEVEGCHRVELKTDVENERSQRAIERLGAEREGILREQLVRVDGSYRSSVYYGILSSEWPAVRRRLEGFLARPWRPDDPMWRAAGARVESARVGR